ncbi:helix-turn-helix transcriptional regulator [Streptomyces sp. 796.1]|uniref:helix-turn-helix transcriptional regulator n=1 Tax=Streptomyces sp. 796.1 TaxID=3163029 RepID=UPI0039C8DA4D
MLATLEPGSTQERVYQSMLGTPAARAGDIAARLDIETAEVQACLPELLRRNLLQESFDVPGAYVAVDPTAGLRQVVPRQNAALPPGQRTASGASSALLRTLAGGSRQPAATAGVERLTGTHAVQQRVRQLVGGAGHEVLSLLPGDLRPGQALHTARRAAARTLDRGGSVRTMIGHAAGSGDDAHREYGHWLSTRGGEFRTVADAPLSMIIADRRSALIPADPRDPVDPTDPAHATDPAPAGQEFLHLTDKGLVAPLLTLFEQMWATARPLDTPRVDLSDLERDLLRLIAQGLTDASAASRLHISPRTARRMMAAIMDRLGARSRFEAGLKSARTGLI